jgi:VIT1/CCC1 family predicted Fe2+/Mn2+ transporter
VSDWRTGHEPDGIGPLARHYLKDLIYGANDGIITTFAVVSGVAGANLETRIVLILGFANLLGDGFSMGASNFLSIRSDEAARSADGRPPQEPFPMRHAAATFTAFVIAGTIPLLSFLAMPDGRMFQAAVVMTLLALFLVGSARALVTDRPWIRAGVEMLLVGSVAAAVAYGVGAWVGALTG